MERPVLFHDSRNTIYRAPFGAVPTQSRLTLRLDTEDDQIEKVFLRLWREEIGETLLPMEFASVRERKQNDTATEKKFIKQRYTVTFSLPEKGCLVWYYFQIQTREGKKFYYGNNEAKTGGVGQTYENLPPSFQITVYDESSVTPPWLKDAVIYQIFPDRFNRGQVLFSQFMGKKGRLLHSCWDDDPHYVKDPETGDVLQYDFFGGTLEGIREKLDYLQDLGINCIYLNPIFESRSNHRYDTGDYKKVDPFLGTEEDLKRLCKEASQRGIRILLDGVFSHTGADSVYFNQRGNYPGKGAYQSQNSPYVSWYRFKEYPKKYDSWWGDKSLPEIDEKNPTYLDFIIEGQDSVLCHWLNAGISGWRLDVADELPDVFLQAFYKKLKEKNKEAVLLGEVWEDASNKVSYGYQRAYLCGGKLDGVMNYVLRDIMLDFVQGRSDAREINARYLQQMENYPLQNMYSMMNLLGSHDVERILTLTSQKNDIKGEGEKRLLLLWAWQMTLPGAPSIYYGDEAGLQGGKDPENRRTYPWGREDKHLQACCRELVHLRRRFAALRTGRMIPVYAEGDVYVYARSIEGGQDVFGQSAEDGTFFIALNRGKTQKSMVIATINLAFGELCQMSPEADQGKTIPVLNGSFSLTLESYGYRVFQCIETKRDLLPRQAGILLHPTSLPGPDGVEKVRQAERFIDFLAAAKQKVWQILPLNPPDAGGSPYNSPSAFAGYDGLFTGVENGLPKAIQNTQFVWSIEETIRFMVQKEAKTSKFIREQDEKGGEFAGFAKFCRQNQYWLPDYVLYQALKAQFRGVPWQKWPKLLRQRDKKVLTYYAKELAYQIKSHAWEQYEFHKIWLRIKRYANHRKISIFGDLPIFVAADSADCWSHPDYFYLDEQGYPLESAGVPPDYFSEKGQVWGNPLYRWERMEQDGFRWWVERLGCLSERVDWLRIDHFRGFEACWAVPGKAKEAVEGRWVKGPGKKLFDALQRAKNKTVLIAEDLGIITPEVYGLKQELGLPGMRILQFHWHNREGGNCDFATEPHCIAYTGTHDNNTLRGWWEEELTQEERLQLCIMADKGKRSLDVESIFSGKRAAGSLPLKNLLAYLYSRQANIVIVPLQDFLFLPSESRMNCPGTTQGNWLWQVREDDLNAVLSQEIAALTIKYERG